MPAAASILHELYLDEMVIAHELIAWYAAVSIISHNYTQVLIVADHSAEPKTLLLC